MLATLLRQAEPWFIGLWRFREAGRPTLWCATYIVNGQYYDVTQRRTPEKALRVLIASAKRLEKQSRD